MYSTTSERDWNPIFCLKISTVRPIANPSIKVTLATSSRLSKAFNTKFPSTLLCLQPYLTPCQGRSLRQLKNGIPFTPVYWRLNVQTIRDGILRYAIIHIIISLSMISMISWYHVHSNRLFDTSPSEMLLLIHAFRGSCALPLFVLTVH